MSRRVPWWYYRANWAHYASPGSVAWHTAHHGPKPHPPIKPDRNRTHRRTQR